MTTTLVVMQARCTSCRPVSKRPGPLDTPLRCNPITAQQRENAQCLPRTPPPVLAQRNMRLAIATLLLYASVEISGLAISRRRFVAAAVPIVTGAPALAAPAEADLVRELMEAKASLVALPKLVGDQSWDAVRKELRQPSVNALWNTMDSGNTLRKLAKARGDGDIIEAAEDVARNLRDVDQMVYGNAFSMEGKWLARGCAATAAAWVASRRARAAASTASRSRRSC